MRDVSYDEDRCRVRTGHLPRNLACLTNLAISIVRLKGRFDYLPQALCFAASPALRATPPRRRASAPRTSQTLSVRPPHNLRRVRTPPRQPTGSPATRPNPPEAALKPSTQRNNTLLTLPPSGTLPATLAHRQNTMNNKLILASNKIWPCLSTSDSDRSPISLLGALDVALYRQGDERFREYAAQAVIKLCDDGFGQQQDIDFYRLLWIFTRFAVNRINLIENGSRQPGFWKRMCAWMQAQFVARALSRAPASIAMDSLEEWSISSMALVGAYAELVDAREEPMLLFTERLPSSDLRCEVLGRLVALRSRHTNEGRHIPQSEEIDRALERARERGNWLKCFFPGPLEGHRRPIAPASEELADTLKEVMPDLSLPASWHFIANASHLHALGEFELGAAREALTRLPHLIDEGQMQNDLLSLEVASIVAKTSRDTLLADAIGDAVTSVGTRASNERDIWLILVICLQAAAAFRDHDAWFDWLEERLARIASCLPGHPNRSVRIFLEHLDAMETILPIDSWFHRRARAIASAGAELRP